jgi:hypothetical protein
MTEDVLYLAIFLLGMAVGGALVALLHEAEWFKRHIADEAPEESDQFPDVVAESTAAMEALGLKRAPYPGPLKPIDQFDVTGKPRAVPWHIRKRELEEAARTKRRRLESFREAE